MKNTFFRTLQWWATLTLICTHLHASAQAAAQLDKNRVHIGESVRLTITVPAGWGPPREPDFSAWDSLVPPDDRYQYTGWKQNDAGWQCTLTFLPPADSGRFVLPAVTIPVSDGRVVVTPELPVEVSPVTPAREEIYEIKPIWLEKLSWKDYLLPVLVCFLGGLLLMLAWWYFFKKRKHRQQRSAPKVQSFERSPEEIALLQLRQLAQKKLWQSGNLKDYYTELTHILREFVAYKYQIPALESTSDEWLAALQKLPQLSPRQLAEFASLLQAADLTKFARATPPDDFHERAFQYVENFIVSVSSSEKTIQH